MTIDLRSWIWGATLLFWLGAGLAWGQRERVLTRRSSPFGELLVTQEGHERILKMRQGKVFVEQSRCDVRRPTALLHQYSRLQTLGVLYPRELEKVLVVGLGGASVSKALLAAYPTAEVDSIELDPVIVELARRYFFYDEKGRGHTFTEDARAHLEASSATYDLIILDAFDGLEIPTPLRTREFYELVQRHLRPGGVVASNLHRGPNYDRDRATLAAVFPRTCGFEGLGLVVVVSGESLTPHPARWSSALGFPPGPLLELQQPKPDWDAQATPFRD